MRYYFPVLSLFLLLQGSAGYAETLEKMAAELEGTVVEEEEAAGKKKAAEAPSEVVPATDSAGPATTSGEITAPVREEEAPVLEMGVRIDSNYSVGVPSLQGFSVPSLRLEASGEAGPFLSYSLAAGQTREFSTLMLP